MRVLGFGLLTVMLAALALFAKAKLDELRRDGERLPLTPERRYDIAMREQAERLRA